MKFLRMLRLALPLLAGLGLASTAAADGQSHNRAFNGKVAGSYVIAVNLGEEPLLALATMSESGGVVATDTDDFGYQIEDRFHSPKHGQWVRTGKKRIGITLYEFGYLDDDINTPILVYKLVFDAEYDSNALYEGSGTVQFSAYLLDSPDPLDLDGGTPVGGGSGSFTFRRAGL